MRLTLRTMLAYMDDILEPADREEIGKKIEETEFARTLLHRIREAVRKPRLGAPKLDSKGGGLDPNTVAEYLDNTLEGARVPDFERVCLESDMHLAEVAACHQVLTMVLGQPAEVDAEMKRRMYNVEARSASPPPVMQQALDGRTPSESQSGVVLAPPRQRPEIPAYLRDHSMGRRWRSFAAGLIILVVLVGVIALAIGPPWNKNPIARVFGFGKADEAPAGAVDKRQHKTPSPESAPAESPDRTIEPMGSMEPMGSAIAPSETGENQTSPPSAVDPIRPTDSVPSTGTVPLGTPTDTAPPGTAAPTTSSPHEPQQTGVPSETVAPSAASPDTVTRPDSTPTDPLDRGVAPDQPPPIPTPMGEASRVIPGASPPSLPAGPGPVPSETIPPGSPPATTPSATPPTGIDPLTGNPIEAPATTPPGESDMALGRFVPGNNAVLLRFSDQSGQWSPVAAGSALAAGDKLLVLPTYRPTIALSAGITLQVPSETLLELEPTGPDGVPGVKMHYGRLVAFITGRPGTQLRIDTGATRGVATFSDGESTLGVDVRRSHSPGQDPVATEPETTADLYAVSGHLQWTDANGGGTKALSAPAMLTLSATGATDATAPPTIPKWISAEEINSAYRGPSLDFAQKLEEENKPVVLILREMAEHRRAEFKSFGAQSLALLGQYEPLLSLLNDEFQRSMWPAQIASLRDAIHRGPDTAVKVREALVRQRGETEGSQLFRMLWGYTADDLKGGDAARLVGYLDHEGNDFRVLALANLNEITGQTYSYRPESPAAARKAAVNRWKEELRTGRIVPREALSPKPHAAQPAGIPFGAPMPTAPGTSLPMPVSPMPEARQP